MTELLQSTCKIFKLLEEIWYMLILTDFAVLIGFALLKDRTMFIHGC